MTEYPFKDLLPIDEVLEREGYYNDWTHLDPEVFYSLTQISEYIKTKGYGVDVRLLISQLAEHFGLKTTQVVDLANLLQQKFDNLEGVTQSFTNNINSIVAQMEADKDAVIANATVDSEVILARGDKPTLGARLDETTTQLAQTATGFDRLNKINNGVLQYGRITLPSDFPRKLPFNLFRNNDGAIYHDFDFDIFETDATNVYIKHLGGVESNDGLTTETGVQSMSKALSIANSLPSSTVVINILDDIADYRRFYDAFQHNITKDIVIKSASPSGRTVYHCGQPPSDMVWTPNGDIFQTNRTSCVGVFDNKYRGEFDTVLDYIKVDSVQRCRETKPSYYTDGTDVYVNTLDGRKPDEQLVCQVTRNINMRFDISDGKRLVMRGIDWLLTAKSTSTTIAQDTMRISAGANINNGTEFWAEDCSFGYCDYDNGLATVAIDSTYLFKCRAYKNGRDGFNYHMRAIDADNKPLAFEYGCAGYTNGTTMANTSSNASTAHDGYNIVRVNSVGYDCYGTLFADVNGCYTIMYDCKAGESTLPFDHVNNYAFGFNDWSAQTDGKAILINCQGGTKTTKAITSDGVPVFVSRFSGDLTGVDIDGLNIL